MHNQVKRGHRRALRAALAGALVFMVVGCADPSSPVACIVPSAAEAIPAEGVLVGINPDWEKRSLEQYAAAMGHRPAVAVSFADVPMSATDTRNVVAAGEQVARNGGMLLLTLEPKLGLRSVTPAVAADVATVVSSMEDTGTTVVVRFAHEMNGSWYAWGQQPAQYIAAFRTLAKGLRQGTQATAMMWAPNYGGGYPFTGGAFEAQAGTDEFVSLDTDGDGALTEADDPYAAYYPGDDVVGWVGMSLYHWGSTHPWGQNEMPEVGKFAQQLTGEYNGLDGDETQVPNFYALYGADKNKPVAIPETAAFVVYRGDVAGELAIKRAWWQQIFSEKTATELPALRMINWFEWKKFEPEVGETVDWTILSDTATTELFVADLPSWAQFASEPQDCNSQD
ncbi:hypothetical protein ABIB15_000959 [Marisediminicola sp. UYEF4]|uniref:glycoside hydrolase family 26 protein n=1 Tax=Marisediminicola sp. UYEF4 TaxID=1756384 RepID=UPI0033986477